jgi:hypothetical protein
MRKTLLIITFSAVILVGGLHHLGSIFYWYWDSFYFDFLMHFLGGFSMGLLFLWGWYASGLFGRSTPGPRESFLGAFFFALFIGIGWEFFEYVYKIAVPAGANYTLDTFHDVAADMLGGISAGLLGRVRRFYE